MVPPTSAGLQVLNIDAFRNLSSISINGLSAINILEGDNGSGKTSFLEAIHFLASSKSFRTTKPRSMIQKNYPTCTVFAHLFTHNGVNKIGVSRSRNGELKLKINNQPLNRLADLASELPVLALHQDSYNIFHAGPSARRQLIDWGVFHVEHHFKDLWLNLNKTIKQRNSLLRSGANTQLIHAWDASLLEITHAIDHTRLSYLKQLEVSFIDYVSRLLPDLDADDFEISYVRGWVKSKSYKEVLEDNLVKDKLRGYTQFGAHRAHFTLKYQDTPAQEVLSRGQIKLTVLAIKLAQLKILNEIDNKLCVFLLDDLPAEIDSRHLKCIVEVLESLSTQLFITCIDAGLLTTAFSQGNYRLFHVEHGKINVTEKQN